MTDMKTTEREIFVWEILDDKKGDLWESIKYDPLKIARRDAKSIEYKLKCDFRLPNKGILGFPGKKDDECMEFAYAIQGLKIHNYKAGKLQDPSPETKKEWDALPKTRELDIQANGIAIVIICEREIVDPLEHSIEGFYYVYTPKKLIIKFAQ